jgi:c-di-GMP-binding flagellar brake protein YcgR
MGPEGDKTGLTEGEVCVVRGFTGQYEFSFLSKVLQTFEKPFVYALLAYPSVVDGRMVRQSMRTKVSWTTTVRLGEQAAAAAATVLPVTLIDISMQGAMIKASTALTAIGQNLTISLAVTIDEVPTTLSMVACVCHNNKSASENAFFVGLAFKNLTQHDKLVLHYLTQSPEA